MGCGMVVSHPSLLYCYRFFYYISAIFGLFLSLVIIVGNEKVYMIKRNS